MAKSIIEVKDLCYSYEDGFQALANINITIAEGDFLAIIGQNGSGKTTLVKHFNRLHIPNSGKVIVDGIDTAGSSIGQLAKKVGFVFQNPDHQISCSTTIDEIKFGPKNLYLSPEEIDRRANEAMALFGLEEYASRPPAILGFGLRRKVTLAAVYAMQSRIIILDEPTAGLEWRSARELMEIVLDMQAKGHTIILVTHDMRIVADYTNKTLVMKDGGVLMYDYTRDVFKHVELLRQSFITPPQITVLAADMAPLGFQEDILTVKEFVAAFKDLKNKNKGIKGGVK